MLNFSSSMIDGDARRILLAGVPSFLLVLALAGCGDATAPRVDANQGTDAGAGVGAASATSPDPDLCSVPAKDPAVNGDQDGPVTLIATSSSTVEGMSAWLGQRAKAGAPTVALSSYEELDTSDPATP